MELARGLCLAARQSWLHPPSAKVVNSDGTTGPDVPFYHVAREDEGK